VLLLLSLPPPLRFLKEAAAGHHLYRYLHYPPPLLSTITSTVLRIFLVVRITLAWYCLWLHPPLSFPYYCKLRPRDGNTGYTKHTRDTTAKLPALVGQQHGSHTIYITTSTACLSTTQSSLHPQLYPIAITVPSESSSLRWICRSSDNHLSGRRSFSSIPNIAFSFSFSFSDAAPHHSQCHGQIHRR
jgi:hypothetical protein